MYQINEEEAPLQKEKPIKIEHKNHNSRNISFQNKIYSNLDDNKNAYDKK